MRVQGSGRNELVTITLEFWPDYNAGPLWTADGQEVDLAWLGLSEELQQRLVEWNGQYLDQKLPFDQNDLDWLGEGRELLSAVRSAVGEQFAVVATEPWWGKDPSEF